jgi:thiol-disulfide isomerase/thioredoxin
MKKVFLQLLLILFPLSVIAQNKGMVFETGTFAQALAKAKQENKKVFVDCYTQWCGPCHYMSTNVFPTDSCGIYMNSRFVNVKMDMEHGEGPALQKQFNVKAYPTFIIFNADGTEMNRFVGMSPTTKAFTNKVGRILKDQKPEDVNEDAVAKRGDVQSNEKDTIYNEGKGINYVEGLDAALAKAKQENKLVLVICSSSWCSGAEMEKTVFKDTRVGNFINHLYIPVIVDLEKEGDGKNIRLKYNVNCFPTFLLLNPDGTEYNRRSGGGNVTQFIDKIVRCTMGEEDPIIRMQKMQEEYYKKAKQTRKMHLTQTPCILPNSKVNFEKTCDLKKAINKAKKLNKKIYAFISDGEWESKYMTDNVFQEDEAAGYLNKNFINLFVDAKSISGDALMDKYQIMDQFPYNLILDSKGDVIGSSFGKSKHSDLFIKELERISKNKKQ